VLSAFKITENMFYREQCNTVKREQLNMSGKSFLFQDCREGIVVPKDDGSTKFKHII
jgi:hypothetical protein